MGEDAVLECAQGMTSEKANRFSAKE